MEKPPTFDRAWSTISPTTAPLNSCIWRQAVGLEVFWYSQEIWCNGRKVSHPLDPKKAILKKLVAIFNTGDVSEVDLIFSPDYIDHQRPTGMDIDGPDAFKKIVMDARGSSQKLEVIIEDLLAEEDKVATRLGWHIIDLTGKKIDRETIEILRFVNGQVVEHWGAEVWRSERAPE